ncbi:sugar ABC transporter substrate-binding protein [Nonomuraea sp. NPDC049152]|uniref:ABC transporter substrate-binding protein n=1 Tax=Nonomuraea sp. NPDC049152 TaxID=3154350 RepID=UPI0033F6C176
MLRKLLIAGPLVIGLVACGSTGRPESGGTITVWDYYGSSTPIKPVLAAFAKVRPDIKVDYQAYDYDTLQQKFATAVGGGTAPDVVTLDMTWIPAYAAKKMLADLPDGAGTGFGEGARDAMRFGDRYVTALYDFDAYALYYRKDLIKIPPKTWSELEIAAKSLKKGKVQVLPDTFHFAQFLFQAGGDILADGKAAFHGPQGVKALTALRSLLKKGGVYWGEDQGDPSGIAGIKDGRIAMFLNGPYMMGVLKEGAPEQKGKWAVAPAPIDARPGSYLGGTGLSIPVTSRHQEAAWTFIEFLLRPEQQVKVFTVAGAAPATEAALKDPALAAPDPYFGGQVTFPIFQQALAGARHYPYVKQWSEIDRAIQDGVTTALRDRKTPQQALTDAAKEVDDLLAD